MFTSLQTIHRQSLAEEVATQVRNAILAGELTEGCHISEIALAKQLGVSRIPVREALVDLEHDGVVISDSRGRCRVRVFTSEDLSEVLTLRLTLETMSASLAAKHYNAENLQALEANLEALKAESDLTRKSQLDVEFHDLIMQASHHRRLLECWRTLRTQFALLLAKAHRWQEANAFPVTDHALRGHLPILQAIQQRNSELAANTMKKHILEWGEWMPELN